MGLYTRGGDKGQTSLLGGVRVPKDTLRIEVYGTLDETTSTLGLARSLTKHDDICRDIIDLQGEFIGVMAELASVPAGAETSAKKQKIEITPVQPAQVERLERKIDHYEQERFPSHHFVRPGGSAGSAALDMARTIIRRAERRLITLSREEEVNPNLITYFNRLSDLFYVMARVDEQREIEQAVLNQFKALGLEAPLPAGPGQGNRLMSLTLADCDRMIEAGLCRAKEIGVPMVLAVVDAAGHVVETRRMDDALIISITLAPNKAYTAATVRIPTHELAKLSQPDAPLYSIDTNIPNLTLIGGGLPLRQNGRVVGGVGVSGGSVEQDIEVAQAMVAAF
ncbi:MAG: cob(I)yrinic acid a,c-diamide adenosyltransferase [Anaerolineales bacterium]|nr:cob(I)yrinic acid a,c-diamide adenosyltransferase [Anaerolineales bacterium]